MDKMQFRDYIFSHNPASIAISEETQTAVHFRPGAGDYLQRLGPKSRTVTCKGAFWGEDYAEAASQMEHFRTAAKGDAGILFVPGMEPFAACLTGFSAEASGDGRILPYTMVFTEVIG